MNSKIACCTDRLDRFVQAPKDSNKIWCFLHLFGKFFCTTWRNESDYLTWILFVESSCVILNLLSYIFKLFHGQGIYFCFNELGWNSSTCFLFKTFHTLLSSNMPFHKWIWNQMEKLQILRVILINLFCNLFFTGHNNITKTWLNTMFHRYLMYW